MTVKIETASPKSTQETSVKTQAAKAAEELRQRRAQIAAYI